MIEDGQNGYLLNPGDLDTLRTRLAKLIQDEELRKLMGGIGKEKCLAEFNEDTVIKKLIDIVKKV
jgi:glycosyltransferase involved in cell wall biosynthesis